MILDLPIAEKAAGPQIRIEVVENADRKAFGWEVSDREIRLSGTEDSIRRAGFHLEDHLNLREGPFLQPGKQEFHPQFSPRMIHSGWGMDEYPDSHLRAIAHAGFDSIIVFVKGMNRTAVGELDFNDLIRRAAVHGLGVYFYSYLDTYKSPDDPDTDEFFDQSVGTLFRECPEAKGLILVGESCYFPTKDPRANPAPKGTPKHGDPRPVSGFFPCSDYPEWLDKVKKAVRKYAPEADIVFWTYNWGKQPAPERIALIDSLPKDITLEATFEMFEIHRDRYPNHQMMQTDYSITFPGPGTYFTSEAEAAKRNGLKLYAMANTGGTTWDCGVMPGLPVPQQFFRRFDALLNQRKNGLAGLMDSHHYGWFPTVVCECARWKFYNDKTDLNDLLRKIAVRDFGEAAADAVVEAWSMWSSAVDVYTPGFEDLNGPFRIGPAYPFIFQTALYPHVEANMKFPVRPGASKTILDLYYHPEQIYGMTFCGRRVPEEIACLERASGLWEQGCAKMADAMSRVPTEKQSGVRFQSGAGEFFRRTLRTAVHIKRWWLLNRKLEVEYDFDAANAILDEMERIAREEAANAESAIPLVEYDSRLGWEPSMDYRCDPDQIRWKLALMKNLIENTLPAYRATICRYPELKSVKPQPNQ